VKICSAVAPSAVEAASLINMPSNGSGYQHQNCHSSAISGTIMAPAAAEQQV
jgi:hypothetical protein